MLHETFRYVLYFKSLFSSDENITKEYNSTTTSSTALSLQDLLPNTQYVIYVTATNDMGTSRPSETLLAWTDPAYPAFVEVSFQIADMNLRPSDQSGITAIHNTLHLCDFYL